MTPMEDGIRAAGTVEIAGLKKPINKNILNMIEIDARNILPKLGNIKSQWMGFRPTLPDSLPVIGESQKCNNVYYAFGHQHLGLSLAAVTGKVKAGSKAAKRRKSYCARSAGQMKKFPKAAKNPNSRLRQARKRWKC